MCNLSRLTHRALTGRDVSWCAFAWVMRDRSKFWASWVWVFGERHCENSWNYYDDLTRG